MSRSWRITYAVVIGVPLVLLALGLLSNSVAIGRLLGTVAAMLVDPLVAVIGIVLGLAFHRRPLVAGGCALLGAAVMVSIVSHGPVRGPMPLPQVFLFELWAIATWVAIAGSILGFFRPQATS